eukprot:12045450-Ditylum_brightwellii.AAC.1
MANSFVDRFDRTILVCFSFVLRGYLTQDKILQQRVLIQSIGTAYTGWRFWMSSFKFLAIIFYNAKPLAQHAYNLHTTIAA